MEKILREILAEPEKHARWLNTLSLLEFLGSRKIARVLEKMGGEESVLRHLAEEARHALFFKGLIRRLTGGEPPDYSRENLLAPWAARRYFHGLDISAARFIKNRPSLFPDKERRTALCYVLVTALIEERAGEVYRLYDALLQENGHSMSLRSLLKEEENHLSEMYRSLKLLLPREGEALLEELRGVEAKLFGRFQEKLAREASIHPEAQPAFT